MVFNVKSKGAIIYRLCFQTFDYDMCETRGKPNGNLLMKGINNPLADKAIAQ